MGLAGNKSSRRAGLEDAELHSMLANAQEQSTGGTWRRAVAGAGTLIVGCACVAATLDGGAAAPGVLALSGDKVGKGAVSTAAKHPKSDWGIGDEVVSDFHKVLQGHFTSEKSKTTAPSEATYLLRMGLVQKSTRPGEPTPGGSMITGLKDQSGAGTLLPAKYKAEAAAWFQNLAEQSAAGKATPGASMITGLKDQSGAGTLLPAKYKAEAAARLQTLAEQGAAQSTAAKATPAWTEALMNKYRLSEGILQGHFTSEKSKTTAPSEATYLLRMGLVQKSTRPGEPTPGGSMITGLKDQSGAGTLLPAKYKAEAAAWFQNLAEQSAAGKATPGASMITGLKDQSGAGTLLPAKYKAEAAARLQTLAEQGAAQSTAAKATPARTEALMNKYRLSEGIPQNGLPEDAVAQSRKAVSDSLKRLLLQARQAETAYGHVQYAMARLQGAVGTLSQIAGQVHAQQQY